MTKLRKNTSHTLSVNYEQVYIFLKLTLNIQKVHFQFFKIYQTSLLISA